MVYGIRIYKIIKVNWKYISLYIGIYLVYKYRLFFIIYYIFVLSWD